MKSQIHGLPFFGRSKFCEMRSLSVDAHQLSVRVVVGSQAASITFQRDGAFGSYPTTEETGADT